MSNFPPPPPNPRFPAPPGAPGASRFAPPPPAAAAAAPQGSNPSSGGFAPPPPPANGGVNQLNSAMNNMSMQSPPPPPQAQQPPTPQQPRMFTPPAFSQPGAPFPNAGAPPGPPAPPGQPAAFQPPPPGGAPKPAVFQPAGVAAAVPGAPPAGGPAFFQPGAPRPVPPGGSMMPPPGAAPQATQPAGSSFYPQTPVGGQMDRAPPAMVGAPQVQVNDNIDYSISIPEPLFRLTAGKLPSSASQAQASKIPLGAILRPLAPLKDANVDVVQPGTAGIVRCKRCRTYINAFVTWSEHGRRWRCNICGQINDCPSAYFCHLDEQGLRRDRFERPELSKGVVEYVAPAEYMVRPPQEPSYFFVLDVSATAVRSGMLACAARAIKASLDDLPGKGRTKIGFITFDNAVHYYNLGSDLTSPQMLVVSDLKQLFVPLPENLMVNLRESRAVVESFLDSLPEMFSAHPVVSQSCLGSALKAAFTVMKEVGGKMCIFQSILPNLGDGILKPREQPALMGTPNEMKVLKPEISWYKDTAIEFSRQQISVDMFLFPYQYMDLSSLGELARYSAGSLFSYPSFHLEKDGPRFEEQLRKTLTQQTAFEAVMRIRCTKGMKITNFYGNFFIRGQDLMALPNCNTDAVFGFDLSHDEQNVASTHVTVQAALLYTSSDGERRIRVLTQALPVTSSNTDVMASVDTDACITLLAKQALAVAQKTSLDNARMRLQQMCVDMIRASKGGDKRVVSGYTVPQQDPSMQEEKPIPENLKLLPLYTLATMKNVALRGGTDVHPDERIQAQYYLNRFFVQDSIHFLYPRMFAIHAMSDQAGLPAPEGSAEKTAGRQAIVLPPVVSLSVDRLNSDGVFLLDNGVEMYLWVGRTADMNVMGSLFGVHTLDEVDVNQVKVLTSGDSFANRFGAIVEALREHEADPFVIPPKINVVREGDAFMEGRFFWFMVEDRASFQGGTHSYEEFMQFVQDPNASSGPRPPPGGPRGGMPPPGQPRGMPPPGRPGPLGGMGGAPPPPGGMPGPPPPGGMGGPPPPPGAMPGLAHPGGMGGPPHPGGMPGPPPPGGMGGPPPPGGMPGPPPPGGMGGPPPPGYGVGGPPMPGAGMAPPRSAPPVVASPPPGPPGGFGAPPPQQGPPHSGGYGAPPPGPPGGFGAPPQQGPPSGNYGGPPSGGFAAPPPRHAMPPPPPR